MTTHTAVGEPPNHGTKITENIYSSSLKQERRARRGSLRGRCPELRGLTCCNQHVLKPLSPLTHQQRVVLLGYFSRISQPANGVFPGRHQQSTPQHNVMPSDSDSDSSSIAHSEEEGHLHSNFNEMEMGTVNRCGQVHRTIQSTIKDVSLFASVFLNCIFLTIILFLLAYHNHLPMYSFSWYS